MPEDKRINEAQDLLAKGDIGKAIIICAALLESNPTSPSANLLTALCFHHTSHLEKAEKFYRLCLDNDSENPDALNNLGALYASARAFTRAEECFLRLLTINPNLPDALCNLAKVQISLDNESAALDSYQKALALSSDAQIMVSIAKIFMKQEKYLLAEEYYVKATQVNPDYSDAWRGLGNIYLARGEVAKSISHHRRSLKLNPHDAEYHSELLMLMHYLPEVTAKDLHEEHIRWHELHVNPLEKERQALSRTAIAKEKLTLGYVSGDLRRHSVAFFFEPLLKAHDRDSFEIICYSSSSTEDEVTTRLRSSSKKWRVISGVSDHDAAQMIQNDGVDILIDLAGHTYGNRMRLFGVKPAPVQMTWLGYPDTTGLAEIDYRITDCFADKYDSPYAEKLLKLDRPFLVYAPEKDCPEVAEISFSKNDYITFGSFNNALKISDGCLEAWAVILNRVTGSRLYLKSKAFDNEDFKARIISSFVDAGISSERILLEARCDDYSAHMARYSKIDIALDTFPYCGTTTTCEALWMGKPVISFCGDMHMSRVGGSILSAVGCDELIANSSSEYIEKACALAGDVDNLRKLSASMRQKISDSQLMNADDFARSMEQVYRQAWAHAIVD